MTTRGHDRVLAASVAVLLVLGVYPAPVVDWVLLVAKAVG